MLGEADAKFPGQEGRNIPPSPSRENPGQAYPKSDPIAAPTASVPGSGSDQESRFITGNPYLFDRALENLEKSIGDVIDIIDEETTSQVASREGVQMKEKLKGWRNDIVNLRKSGGKALQIPRASGVAADEGGLFVD